MKKTTKICLVITAMFTSTIIGAFLYAVIITKDVKLDKNKLENEYQQIEYYDTFGEKIDDVSQKNYVEYSQISNNFINSLIAVEDKRFYTHNGIDAKRIIKASYVNLTSGKYVQGASTISQQLIKNTHLSSEKTFSRKIKEIKLSFQLEKNYTKEKILELYANSVYFGDNVYGIYNASKYYFDKKPIDLDVIESATLVALLKAPNKYNPYSNKEKCQERVKTVLYLMKKNGYLSNYDYHNYLKKDFILSGKTDNDNIYFKNVKKELDEKYNPYELYGCKVYTNYNPNTQKMLENVITSVNVDSEKSGIIIENNKITAYYSTLNYEPKRNPASTIKPLLVYAPAIQEKIISSATKIKDEKRDFNGYSPSNYGNKYNGYVSAKYALSNSLNVPSVEILDSLTIDKANKYLNKTSIKNNVKDLSCALGNIGEGVTLKNLTESYSVFNNKGQFAKAKYIYKIIDKHGNILTDYVTHNNYVFDNETVNIINDALIDCAKNGTAKKVGTLPFEVCAKTGTNGNSNGNFDAYTISYTTDKTIGVWLGKLDGILSNDVTGGNHPALISNRILENLYKEYSPNNFDIESQHFEYVDKYLYDNENKLVIADDNCIDKNKLKFYFRKDNIPKEKCDYISHPKIIDYTIHNTDNKIKISVEKNVYTDYKILENDVVIFDSKTNNEYSLLTNQTYYILPYAFGKNGIIYGDKIKLKKIIKQDNDESWLNEY